MAGYMLTRQCVALGDHCAATYYLVQHICSLAQQVPQHSMPGCCTRRLDAWAATGIGTLCLPLFCSAPKKQRLDDFQVVKYPLTTESAMKKIEDNNTLVSCLQAPWLHR